MKRWMEYAGFSLILFIAALLRLTALNWDEFHHYHPDERYINWVGTTITLPEIDTFQDLTDAFHPHRSTLNPFYWPANGAGGGVVVAKDEPRRFAYGHLPLYTSVIFTKIFEVSRPVLLKVTADDWSFTQDVLNEAGRSKFRHLAAVGRLVTAIVDLMSVGLLYFLGRRLYGPLAGLLASTFLALNVMHIQLAHFLTVDPYLTFFVLLSITFMVVALDEEKNRRRNVMAIIIAAIAAGLAIGSKFSGSLLLIPLTLTVLMFRQLSWSRRGLLLAAALILVSLAFALTNPFAIIDFSCLQDSPVTIGPLTVPERLTASCYLENVISQGTMVRGTRDVPFVRQYAGTLSFVYYLEMQLKWGMGVLLGLSAFGGLVWASIRGLAILFKKLSDRFERLDEKFQRFRKFLTEPARFPLARSELILLAWSLPFFITTGLLYVKFMRYLLPLTPILMLYAAAMLLSIRPRWFRRLAIGLVIVTTGLYALSFVNTYTEPHPWVQASIWLFENAKDGDLIVSEMWDDNLPDDVFADEGINRSLPDLEREDVNWLSGADQYDNLDKLAENLALISEADYLVLASNRNYGVIPRLPDRYPVSSQYYPLLFNGDLGFEVAHTSVRMPNIFGFHIKPNTFTWPGLEPPAAVSSYLDDFPGLDWGRFDESFTVYDQPLAIILKNVDHLTPAEMLEQFRLSGDS